MVCCVICCLLSLVPVGLRCRKTKLIIIKPLKWQSSGKSAVGDSCMLDSPLHSGHIFPSLYKGTPPETNKKGLCRTPGLQIGAWVFFVIFCFFKWHVDQERKLSQCRRLQMSYKEVTRAASKVLRHSPQVPPGLSLLAPAMHQKDVGL